VAPSHPCLTAGRRLNGLQKKNPLFFYYQENTFITAITAKWMPASIFEGKKE
jgi:hypothetical protein